MLELLDLRERGERLEPSRFEADPTVTETVRGLLDHVRTEMTVDAAARPMGATATIARAEGLVGHAATVKARGERP